MAAIRPIAVANSASAMPGATTASEVFLEAAIDWKLDMMPQTVPNRPTNGPAEPTVASTRSRRSSRSISRAIETFVTFSHRRDEPRRHRLRRLGREGAIKLLDRLPGPACLLEAIHGALGARIQEHLVDGDRPDPDRTGEQSQHDRFHNPMGLQEQRDQRYV